MKDHYTTWPFLKNGWNSLDRHTKFVPPKGGRYYLTLKMIRNLTAQRAGPMTIFQTVTGEPNENYTQYYKSKPYRSRNYISSRYIRHQFALYNDKSRYKYLD